MRRITALISVVLVLYTDFVYALYVPVNPNSYQPSAALTKVVVGGVAGAALVASGAAVAAYGGATLPITELGSLTASGAVHGGIIGFVIEKNPDSLSSSLGGSSSTATGALAVVLANPDAPVPSSAVPAGWSQPTSGAAPVPPVLVSPQPTGWICTGTPNCAYVDVNTAPKTPYYGLPGVCPSGQGFQGIYNTCAQQVTACPAGYTGASNCTLSNPAQVQKPAGSAEVIKPASSGINVAHDPQLPAAERINGLTVDANNVTFKDSDSGDTVSVDYDASGQMTKMTISVPSTSPNSHAGAASASSGTSQASTSVDTVNFSADSSNPGQSIVTGTTHQTFSGTGSAQSSTPVQQVESVGGSSGSGSSNCQGCALESTQQAVLSASNQTNTKLDRLHDDLNGSDFNNQNVDAQGQVNQALSTFEASGNAMSDVLSSKTPGDINYSWVPSILPGQNTACTPILLESHITHGLLNGVSGHGFVDICDKLNLARQIAGYIFGLVTIIFIYRAFVRSNGAPS
jgi:hypothetical protein